MGSKSANLARVEPLDAAVLFVPADDGIPRVGTDVHRADDPLPVCAGAVELVVGRYDCCCTPDNSFDLAQRLERANLVVV